MTDTSPTLEETESRVSNQASANAGDGDRAPPKIEAENEQEGGPSPAMAQPAQLLDQGADVGRMLATMLPAIKTADTAAQPALLGALARACADHPQSLAALWDGARRSFAARRSLLHLTASAIAEASPEYALDCWRSLAAGEPGFGKATTEYAKALMRRARVAVEEGDIVEAIFTLHDLRRFGAASGNHQWFHEGLPLLAQINFALGNRRLGLQQYKTHRQALQGDEGDERVFASPVSAITTGPRADLPRETVPPLAVPTMMPRLDFERIGSGATFEATIGVLEEATVLPCSILGSHLQAVLTRQKELLIDQFNIHPRYYIAKEKSFLRAVSPDEQALVDLSHHPRSRFLPGDHVLLGGAPNYYHWLFEYLPRMESVVENRIKFDSLLVNSGFEPYQSQSLTILMGGVQNLTFLNTDTAYTCEKLYAPTLRPISEAVAFLRKTFITKKNEGAPRRKLFLSRSDAHPNRVRIANEDALYSAIQPLGFERIVLSTLDFSGQVDLFQNAEIIVAAHGAGLTNIVFAPPDCAVFEINNPTNQSYTFFEEIAKLVGQPFHRLVFDGNTNPGILDEDVPSEVDVKVLLERLRG